MPEESVRKHLVVEHCRRVNAADLTGLLALYSPDVRFEDPVGTGWRTGIEALRAHAGAAIENRAHEDFGTPVAAQDGASAAVPVTTTMGYLPWGPNLVSLGFIPAPPPADVGPDLLIRFRYVMAIKVGAAGRITEMQGFWGPSDVEFIRRG